MANVNKVFLLGRLTRDPELRYTKTGTPVAEFSLAINREYTDANKNKVSKPCFVDVLTWKRTAELVSEYLSKGRQVFIEGRLELDTWESQEGQKRSKLRVVAENVQFLGSKGGGGGGRGGDDEPALNEAPADSAGDDDIPF